MATQITPKMQVALAVVEVDRPKAWPKYFPDEVTPDLRDAAMDYLADIDTDFGFLIDMKAKAAKDGDLSAGMVKGVLNCMLAEIRRQKKAGKAAEPAPVVPEGIHFADGDYIKVVTTQKGNLVGKVWVGDGWDYRGVKVLFGLGEDTLVGADEAAAFGHLTGRCVFCTAHLTDARSITVGYGPTCAQNHGLPWGEVSTEVAGAQAFGEHVALQQEAKAEVLAEAPQAPQEAPGNVADRLFA